MAYARTETLKHKYIVVSDAKSQSKVTDLLDDSWTILSVADSSTGVHYILEKVYYTEIHEA